MLNCSYLSPFFLEVAFPLCVWGVIEYKLQVGSRGCESHLGVSLAAAVGEANLALLQRPVAVAGVAHLGVNDTLKVK